MKTLSLLSAALFTFILAFGQSTFAVDAVTPAADRALRVTTAEVSALPSPSAVLESTLDRIDNALGIDARANHTAAAATAATHQVATPRQVEDAAAAMVNVAATPDGTPVTGYENAAFAANDSIAQIVAILFGLVLLAALMYWSSRSAKYRREHPDTVRPSRDTAIAP